MIPVTHPSTVNTLTGRREMVISVLSSVSGLVPWNDYIPIRFVDSLDTTEGSYGDETYDGFISVTEIDSTGLTPYNEYVPCYVDNTATDAWVTSVSGYIPVEHSGYSSLRNIATLSGTQYGMLDTVINFAGDFEVEAKFSTTSASVNMALYADTTGSTNYLIISPTAIGYGVRTSIGSYAGLSAINDGKVHTVKAVVTGTSLEVFLDGVSLGTNVVAAPTATAIEFIGKGSGAGNFFNGQILSIKFTNVTTGAVNNYVFDSGSDLYQMARGENLESNLTPDSFDGSFTAATGWTDNADGTASCDGTQTGISPIYKDLSLTTGDSVLITFTVDSYTVGNVRPDAGTTNGTYRSATGTYSEILTVGADAFLRIEGDASFVGTISNISINILPNNTCLLTNFATSDWNRYTLQRNITHDAGTVALGWVGENRVVNGGFDADTGWTKGTGWTIADGVATSDGSQIAPSKLEQSISKSIGDRFLVGSEVTEVNVTAFVMVFGGTQGTIRTVAGRYMELLTMVGIGNFIAQAGTTFEGSVDNMSAKHLLEVA